MFSFSNSFSSHGLIRLFHLPNEETPLFVFYLSLCSFAALDTRTLIILLHSFCTLMRLERMLIFTACAVIAWLLLCSISASRKLDGLQMGGFLVFCHSLASILIAFYLN